MKKVLLFLFCMFFPIISSAYQEGIWRKTHSSVGASGFNSIQFTSSKYGYALKVIIENNTTKGSEIYRTCKSGSGWCAARKFTGPVFYGMYFVSPGAGWLVGKDGKIVYTKGGNVYYPQKSNTNKYLLDVYFVNKKIGWTVGMGGTILHTIDGGNTWRKQSSGFERKDGRFKAVRFINENEGWVVGFCNYAGKCSGGIILHTKNGGRNWVDVRSKIPETLKNEFLNNIYVHPGTGWIYIVGNKGTILFSSNSGKTFESKSIPARNLNGIHFANSLYGWAVGDGNTIYYTRDAGMHWYKQNVSMGSNWSNVNFTEIFMVDKHLGYAVGSEGIYKYSLEN